MPVRIKACKAIEMNKDLFKAGKPMLPPFQVNGKDCDLLPCRVDTSGRLIS
jgi:hypothetical protein